jgi:hypothetical protein
MRSNIREDLHRRHERLIVIHAAYRCLARCLAIAALALLAACTTSELVRQEANPAYVGKPLKSVMVVAVTADEIVRRTFEDRVVVLLGQRGIKGIPGYSAVGTRGRVQEAELREAIAKSGAEGVIITRVTRIDRSTTTVPESTVAVSYGWGGFYGYYANVWQTVSTPAQTVTGATWTVSETRLFDAKNGALAWTGLVDTRQNDKLDAAMMQYINVIFDAMVGDKVL